MTLFAANPALRAVNTALVAGVVALVELVLLIITGTPREQQR